MQTVLLQAASGAGAGYMNIIFIVAMVAIMFLFFIRPQQQKQKKQRDFVNSLEKGMSVVTLGGIHGKIVGLDETTVLLEVDRGTKLKIERSSVSQEYSVATAPKEQK